MGIAETNTNSVTVTHSPQVDRVERLYFGEESDSIGTLFTTNQQGMMISGTQNSSMVNPASTPITQNRSGRTGGSSVGGCSSGTIFTNEEASNHIIFLTEGFNNLASMVKTLVEQQALLMASSMGQQKIANTITPSSQSLSGVQHVRNTSSTNADDMVMNDDIRTTDTVDPPINRAQP
jgi:hypothetical protein